VSEESELYYLHLFHTLSVLMLQRFAGQMKEIMTDISCPHSASRKIRSVDTNICLSHISALSEDRLPCFHFEH